MMLHFPSPFSIAGSAIHSELRRRVWKRFEGFI